MRTKIEYFLSGLNTEIDVSNYVDIDNIDPDDPFGSICKMIEENGGFDIKEFYELEDEINSFLFQFLLVRLKDPKKLNS